MFSRALPVIASAMCLAAPTLAQELPFDFTDDYYRANGINPDALNGRVSGTDGVSVVDNSNTDPDRRNVRMTLSIPGYKHNGDILWFTPFAGFNESAFTNDASGDEARRIADEYPLYIFPQRSNAEFQLFPKRQEDLVPLKNGYFSNDPLGLWVLIVVEYTDAAFNTDAGRDALDELAWENGLAADGTPIIRTESELEDLEDDGFVRMYTLPADGSLGDRWSVCPVIEDPRDGSIAPDAFQAMTTGADGMVIPANLEFAQEFRCLQQTGDYCDELCPADINLDGVINTQDVLRFLSLWNAGDPAADFRDDDRINTQDVSAFLNRYAGGC